MCGQSFWVAVRARVVRGDPGLQRVGAGLCTEPLGARERCEASTDEEGIPGRAVLIEEQHRLPVGSRARGEARGLGLHQGDQAVHLRQMAWIARCVSDVVTTMDHHGGRDAQPRFHHAFAPSFPASALASADSSGETCVKSDISNTWRTSTISSSEAGIRRAHSRASSRDFTWMIQ